MLTLLLACTGPSAEPLDVLRPTAVADSESGATLTISWTTDEPTDALAEVGTDEGYGDIVEGWSSEDGLEHAVVLAGLAGGNVWHWRAISRGVNGASASDDQTFVPGAPPAGLPDLHVTGEGTGLLLAPVLAGSASYLALYDSDGRPVWWRHLGDEFVPVNQARLSLDRRAVLYVYPNTDGTTQLVRAPIAGGPTRTWELGLAHHDFLELEGGGFAYIAAHEREIDGWRVQGDKLVEVDADGVSTDVWSTWDDLQPPALDTLVEVSPGILDWTHVNSVARADGQYWLSSYHEHALYRVDHAGLDLVIGGRDSDLALTAGPGFGPQHAPYPTDDGFLVFNNREVQSGDLWSEAVEFSVDLDAGTYARTWAHDADHEVFSPVFGNVEPTESGDLLVGWGSAGRTSLVSREGEERWVAETPLGFAFGFSHHVAALSGRP